MNLIRLCVARPIAVLASVVLVMVFGLISLQSIPVQLAPDIERPVLSVVTYWPGASPQEVEREILVRQERVLRGIEGVQEIRSEASEGGATITLEFALGHDMRQAQLAVANRLSEVVGYPDETKEPRINRAGSEDPPIAWMMVRSLPGNPQPIYASGDFIEDVVVDRLERIPGIARVGISGGSPRHLRIEVDAAKMARYGLTVPAIVAAVRESHASITAGEVTEGKRHYVVRSESDLATPEEIRRILLRTEQDAATGRIGRVTVGDIADVRFHHNEPLAVIRYRGDPALSMSIMRERGSNVITTMAAARQAIAELNSGQLAAHGLQVVLIYDATTYIDAAIRLVTTNLWLGAALAAGVLFLFLRSIPATITITLAIPISVLGAFVVLAFLGRSINVISLAGLAFSVGMVVDASIIVLENIFRLRQQGVPPAVAAFQGTRRVWLAVLGGAITTVVVFLPLLLLEQDVGQLLRDIAVAISVAILLSLIVAITVIPALANRLLGGATVAPARRAFPLLDRPAHAFVGGLLSIIRITVAHRGVGAMLVLLICAGTGLIAWFLLPRLEYLPEGNRNMVFGAITPPPGYNLATTLAVAESVEAAARPLWTAETGSRPGRPARRSADAAADELPRIDNFFFVARRNAAWVGATAEEPQRVGELIPVLQAPLGRESGTYGFFSQPTIFGMGGARLVQIHVLGPNLDDILDVARRATRRIETALPRKEGNQLRPRPGLELGAPEVRVQPDPVRLADNQLTPTAFGQTLDAFNDGLRIAEITAEGRRIDVVLAGPRKNLTTAQAIGDIPIVTGGGQILPAGSLAAIQFTAGPIEIRHLDGVRAVTLEIRPAIGMSLEAAVETVQQELDALSREGLPPGVQLRLSGTADALNKAWSAMSVQVALALLVVYLLMAILFESLVFPLIILLTVPVAVGGGVVGLAVLNQVRYQPLDMLTLLGFIILIGIVVNNAILIVHQTLLNVRDFGMQPNAAILAAAHERVRPIFLSTMTSIVGLLPLVISPGAGSEVYRGLGTVVLGGLMLSAILTLVVTPPLLALAAPLMGPSRSDPKVPSLEHRHAAE